MTISLAQLRAIYKEGEEDNLKKFLEPLNQTCERYRINNPTRLRYFLSQVGHESGQLRYTQEISSGLAYERRVDLGNTQPGDGVRYKGRGLIQITGRSNYILCGMALDLPLLETPTLLEQPLNAALSAGWYWDNKNLNALCDMNLFEQVTRRINGGLNGQADRMKLLGRAMDVI